MSRRKRDMSKYRREESMDVLRAQGWQLMSELAGYPHGGSIKDKRRWNKEVRWNNTHWEYATSAGGQALYREKQTTAVEAAPTININGLLAALDWAAERIEALESELQEEMERAQQFERQLSYDSSKLSERARRLLLNASRR